MTKPATREQIIETADRLFYQQGFNHTSFSDIAAQLNISRGNFYYHFQTKDDILQSVIEARLEKTREMLKRWEEEASTPKARIKKYMQILNTNWDKIQYYGCPVGTLCTELAKLNHASLPEANRLFTLFRNWLREQFIQLGCEENADELAMQVLAWSQGVATLANAFADKKFAQQEVRKMCNWLDNYNK